MGNQGGLYTWSRNAADNATFDSRVNWQEGQSPSSVNDSGRAMMASAAEYRDDISGQIVTTGTSTAYIVNSFQVFDTLANFNGKTIAFTPHATSGAGPVTMTVDGFANLPLRSSPGVELPSGVLIQGTSYLALFNQADNALYLQGYFGQQSVPLGGMIDYTGSASPYSNWVIPVGQAISRTTYAAYFALVGTTYGVGDGSTTFNVPNLSGRGTAMLDPTGTILTSATMSPNGNTLGATGGAQTVTLNAGEIPEITSNVQVSGGVSGDTSALNEISVNGGTNSLAYTPAGGSTVGPLSVSGSFSGSGAAQSNNTGGAAHPNMQPTLLVNKLLRIA